MADIALRTYYKHIDQLIDQKNLEEALAYCKNILHHFPKDLEAYRLMGKALLERGRHGDAADVFQRVLSAQPDDFISHVGMAIVREDEGNLEAALWHMERAFEASPSNPAVQDELRRLYGRRDGIVPHRAQLTRGALARLYYKQGLYAQAETELRAGLAEQPDRPDLITLLVQVLWENGSRAEAGTLCQDLLQRLPHNLEANRVMAQIAASENRADEARACRARLEALDPYEAYTSAGTSAASVNADAIRITEIAYSPELASPQQPEWSNTLGADLSTQSEDVLPDWVRSGTSLLVSDEASGSTAGPTPDLPDWMRATTGILNSALGTAPEPMPAAPDLSAEPAEPVDEPAPLPTTDFLPDWLTEVANPTAAPEPTALGNDAWLSALTADPETAAPSSVPQASDDLPDWLRGAGAEASDEAPAWLKSQPADAPDDKDWLGASSSEPAPDEGAPLTAAALGAAGAGALLGQPEETHPASANELPDWLQSAAGSGDAAMPDWLSAATGTSEATQSPDWMRVDAPAPADDSVFADDAPEWLRGATGQTGMLGGAKPPESSKPAAFDSDDGDDTMEAAADIPAWLESARPETESAPLDTSVPDWLSSASKQTGTLGDLPDWLKSAEPAVNDVTLPAATVEEPPIPDATIDVRAIEPQDSGYAGGIDLPDWLTTATETPAAATADAAEPGSFDADSFAWLESLAARQGADPAELSSPQTDTGDDIPDWLRTPTDAVEPVDALPAQPEAAAPEAASTPDAMDADDAFAWLESLAARQGVDAGELSRPSAEVDLPDFLQPASPEAIERANTPVDWSTDDAPEVELVAPDADTAEMPEWVKALAPAEDEAASRPLEALPEVDPADLPDWLRPAEAVAPTTETPAVASTDDDAAFAWLESLAAAQGADPETLTAPGADADVPDWLRAATVEAEPAAELPAQPEAAATETPAIASSDDDAAFAWLESLAAAQGADPETLTAPGADADVPDWLRAATVEAEPAAELPAQPEAAATETPAIASSDDDAAFAWLESLAAAQGADPETLTAPGTDADVPDWLRAATVEAEPAAELPAQPEAAATETPAIASSDDDAAFAWLESLAAAQGADPSTLSTAVLEDGAAEVEAQGSQAAQPAVSLPDWLSQDVANTPTEADLPAAATVEAASADDDAFAWLESLAARQGADPETLSVAGEPTSAPASAEIDLPEWLNADPVATSEPHSPNAHVTPPTSSDRTATRPLAEPESEPGLQGVAWLRKPLEADMPPSERGEITLPDWLQDEITPPSAATAAVAAVVAPQPPIAEPGIDEAPAGPPITTSDKRTSMLAGKLAERKRARESEIQDRFERQRAAREAAQREIETKLANRRAGLAPEPAHVASELPTAPLPVMADAAAPEPVIEAAPARTGTGPLDLGRPRWRPRSVPAFADVAPDALLTRSREQLAGGQEATAMSGYTHLIKTGQHVDVILAELQAHIGRGKAGAIAFRTLGDAQMKAGHLQDALASYRAALERS